MPGKSDPPDRKGGTNGVTPIPVPTEEQAARRDALAAELSATGWSPLVCTLVASSG